MGDKCPTCDPERTARERVVDSIAYVRSQIESGKRHGADMSRAEDMLVAAQFLADAGSLDDAHKLVGEAATVAGDIMIQYEALVSAMRRSAKKLKDAQDAGEDISEAAKYFKMAMDAKESNEYKLGITYAVRSAESVSPQGKRGSG
jgi:hypothetical protein